MTELADLANQLNLGTEGDNMAQILDSYSEELSDEVLLELASSEKLGD